MSGASGNTKDFIARVAKIAKPENNLELIKARYEKEPSFANQYFDYLTSRNEIAIRDKAINKTFNSRKDEENYSEENFAVYEKYTKTIFNPIVLSIIADGNDAINYLGKKKYYNFITERVRNTVSDMVMRKTIDAVSLEELHALAKKHNELKTNMYKYIMLAGKQILEKDVEELIKISKKFFKKSSLEDRDVITKILYRTASVNGKRQMITPFVEYAMLNSEGKEVERYKEMLTMINKSK